MIELLNARLEELVAEKSSVENKSDAEAIEELVEAYRAEVTAKYENDKSAKVADIDLEVKAIERLIAKEQSRVIETPVECVADDIEG